MDDMERKNILPLLGLELLPLGCPALSQSLYLLHYLGCSVLQGQSDRDVKLNSDLHLSLTLHLLCHMSGIVCNEV
jgi:hypothetical protein